MYRVEPITLFAENENTYIVRFRADTGEIAFPFKIDEEPFRTLGWEPEFSGMVSGDPAGFILNAAIFEFHEARSLGKHQALELTAEGSDSYRVRFQSATNDLKYTFTIQNFESVKFDGRFQILDLGDPIELDKHFLEVINDDRAVDHLKRAVCYFHQCIHFRYEPREGKQSQSML